MSTQQTIKKPTILYSFDAKIGDKEYRVALKRPTRSQQTELTVFNYQKFGEYVRRGLVTVEQIAKRQIDVGGVLSEEQQRLYAKLHTGLMEKQEILIRLMQKKDMTDDETDLKRKVAEDITIIKNQLSDFEYLKSSVYEMTANSRARNDAIQWFVLACSVMAPVTEGSDDLKFEPVFSGADHTTRLSRFEEMDDNNDPVLDKVYVTLSHIATFIYVLGETNPEVISQHLQDIGLTAKKVENEPQSSPEVQPTPPPVV